MKGSRHRRGEDTVGSKEKRKKKETGRQEEQVRSVCTQSQKSSHLRERWIDTNGCLQGGGGGGGQVKKQRMNKESQDGNKRGPETSGGEKPKHPEPLYKYHLRRGVDDGKRMETG